MKQIADDSGIEVTEEQLGQAHLMQQAQAYQGFVQTLKNTLKDKGAIPTAECPEFDDSLIFVHDSMGVDVLLELLSRDTPEDSRIGREQLEASVSLRKAFQEWNDSLPPEKRFQLLAVLSEPAEVHVYRSRIRNTNDSPV